MITAQGPLSSSSLKATQGMQQQMARALSGSSLSGLGKQQMADVLGGSTLKLAQGMQKQMADVLGGSTLKLALVSPGPSLRLDDELRARLDHLLAEAFQGASIDPVDLWRQGAVRGRQEATSPRRGLSPGERLATSLGLFSILLAIAGNPRGIAANSFNAVAFALGESADHWPIVAVIIFLFVILSGRDK